jgi:hypothetical protein
MAAPKLHVIRVIRDDLDQPKLTSRHVFENGKRGIETSIIPDVNVLYAVRDVFLRKVSLQESGLDEFRNLVNSTGAGVVPGIALTEVIPSIREECGWIFYIFVSELCGLRDDPAATPLSKVDTSSEVIDFSPLLSIPRYYITKDPPDTARSCR